MVGLVESLHQRISTLGGLFNRYDLNKTSGLTCFIYKSIRKTTDISTLGINFALSTFSPFLPQIEESKRRNQWFSILNGLIGDHLIATENPLAMGMTWHHDNQKISPEEAARICIEKNGQPLFLIHGLCMNDQLWNRNGHDHGEALKEGNQFTPIYIRYNTGLPIYKNGQQLAQMLKVYRDALNEEKQFHVLCHSMGGLVMRSALYHGEVLKHGWHRSLQKIIFLGTPHQGAVLEKTGNLIDYLVSINPYSAPFLKLTNLRSHGIKNLRLGTITQNHLSIQLPNNIKCYAFAAQTGTDKSHQLQQSLICDGLVSIDSALGRHRDSKKVIRFSTSNQFVFNQVNHMDLLSNHAVYTQIETILNQSA